MTCPGYRDKTPLPDWWPLVGYTRWQYLTRVWRHHPIENTVVGFWRRFPHRADWELLGWSFGLLDHDPADPRTSTAGVMKQCHRCGFIEDDPL